MRRRKQFFDEPYIVLASKMTDDVDSEALEALPSLIEIDSNAHLFGAVANELGVTQDDFLLYTAKDYAVLCNNNAIKPEDFLVGSTIIRTPFLNRE